MADAGFFAAVRDGAGRNDDVALISGKRAWTYRELITSAEVFAGHLGRHPTAGLPVVVDVADAAVRAVVTLAADLAELTVLHSDPGAPTDFGGLVVRDSATLPEPSEPPAVRTTDGGVELWTHTRAATHSLAGIPARSQIFLTSGSTGTPTGVVRPAATVLSDAHRIAAFMGYEQGLPGVVSTLAFHCYGFAYGIAAPLLHGTPIRHVPSRSIPSQLARAVREHGARTLVGLPFQFQLLAGTAAPLDFGELRMAVSSGAPLPPAAAGAITGRYDFALYNAYGSSETGALSAALSTGEQLPGEVGTPFPGVVPRLVPVDGVSGGGELQLRTDALAAGYTGTDGLLPLDFDGDWYRTGDLARIEDGGIRINGRLKNIINVAGKKVSPAEIERVLARHPAVTDVQVVAAPDDVRGQVPAARIVTSSDLTVAELLAWCQSRLAPHQMPRRVSFLDEIPWSAMGKPLKGPEPS